MTPERVRFSYRADPDVPPFPDNRPIVIFDGKCVLCSGFARFLLRFDRRARLRLLPAQSPLGEALYRHYRLNRANYETYVLLAGGEATFRSEATIGILENLGPPWSLARILRVVPVTWRDQFYDVVARNRLRWFGARDTCFLATPAQRERFLG